MTRRVDPEFQFAEEHRRDFPWRRWLSVVIIALLIAMGAFFLYKNVAAG